MDKVTRQMAANAAESASASEEMNARAEQMQAAADQLAARVSGPESNRPSDLQTQGPGR